MKNQQLRRFNLQNFEFEERIIIFDQNFKTIHCFGISSFNLSTFYSTHTMIILIVTISAILLARAFPILADYLSAATRR